MSQFFESILYQNGQMPLLSWHEQRFAATQFYLYGTLHLPSLKDLIEMNQPSTLDPKTTYKCRVSYGEEEIYVRFEPYRQKKIKRLEIVHAAPFDYALKSEDRSALNTLKQNVDEDAEILIFIKGRLSDTSFTNVALFDGQQWHTPDTPLLQGTRRAMLLENKTIIESPIGIHNYYDFKKIRLFNALVGWNEAWEFPIKK